MCLLYDGSTRRLTESGFMEKPGIEPATPGLQGIALIHYTTGASQGASEKQIFCGFPGYRPVLPGWFMIVCWFYVGNTQRLTESGFMEKPGIEPATPGLQGIALIHYTTGASQIIWVKKKKTFCGFPWVETSTAGRVYDFVCLLYDGSTRRLTESGFLCGFMDLWRSKKKKLFVAFPG